MRNTLFLFLTITITFLSSQCGDIVSNNGLTLSGKINGLNSMQVFLDKVGISPASASLVQSKTDASATGEFSLSLPEPLGAGLYRLRFGAQNLPLILDGTESSIHVTGDLVSLNKFQYEVTGSASTTEYKNMMVKLISQQASASDVSNFIDTTPNSLAAVTVAIQSLGGNRQFLELYNKAKKRLSDQYPGSPYLNEYDAYLTSIQSINNPGTGFQLIEEPNRQPAPDIKLASPSGKEYSLSELKGKVVLVDFWASWCRPCRMENPNVVKVYKKYKDKGFTVFSVSLDGIDSRTAARYNGDSKQLQQAIEDQKKRWKDAIAADGLLWETHVSDLKKWECAPARAYGVSSIPRTFMIDKEGRIAALNLRGEQVEEVLLKLL